MTNIILDGNNHVLIAASVAIKKASTPEEFTDVLYSLLCSTIIKLKKKFDGNFYICWDTYGGTAFRKELDSDYKATRSSNKFDFKAIESCKSVYDDYGIKSISIPHCEGDDAIFVLCRYLKEQNSQCNNIIVSRDHDLIQVVQAGYAKNVYDPSKKDYMEIPYYSIVEYKALTGDSSDNIKGVTGIGPKTALKVISGMEKLTEEQQKQYEHCLDLVDARRNPNYEKNYEYVAALINNN